MLDELRSWLARFVVVLDPLDWDLLTLWPPHTHLVQQTYTTMRLGLDSPVPECGKTVTLEHLGSSATRLCKWRT